MPVVCRRLPFVLATAVACLLLVRVATADDSVSLKRPNILWLVSEDNGTFLGCYEDKQAKTPRLDALAAEGVLYLNAFSNAPVCAPSRSPITTAL